MDKLKVCAAAYNIT